MKKILATAAAGDFERSDCPIANTLDLIGDKWTLLVVRDLLFQEKRLYGELMQSQEKVRSNILAERLKRLENAGMLEKIPYQQNPLRHEYRLTPKGADLFAILKEIIRWGNKYVPGTTAPPAGFLDSFEKQATVEKKKTRRKGS
ncbi:MAG: helix-turn-helix transcriptional regulator [Betaproteobacteria bacterium]|nr:helix-turn-helix transcriptional regulator [Betaproteobacteria bacterium]